MRLYKPFELLFSSIDAFFSWTGVSGSNFEVSGAVSCCQLLNVSTILSLFINKINESVFAIIVFVLGFTFLIFNGIYFNTNR